MVEAQQRTEPRDGAYNEVDCFKRCNVSCPRSARVCRLRVPLCPVSRNIPLATPELGLMLHLHVELCAEKYYVRRKPHPQEKDYNGTKGAVALVE